MRLFPAPNNESNFLGGPIRRGARFRRNLRLSATLADAPWGHRWPSDANADQLGIPFERGAPVATRANVGDRRA
jgi:hypothetical protein